MVFTFFNPLSLNDQPSIYEKITILSVCGQYVGIYFLAIGGEKSPKSSANEEGYKR